MATVSIVLERDESSPEDHLNKVLLMVEHQGESFTSERIYRLHDWEWLEGRNRIIHAGATPSRKEELIMIEELLIREASALRHIAWRMEADGGMFTAKDVVIAFEQYWDLYRLSKFVWRLERGLKGSGRIRTGETYRSAWNSFRNFLKTRTEWLNGGFADDIHLLHVSSLLMQQYEGWLRERRLVPNTISFYMRILRSMYNQAVEEEAVEDSRPFRRVYTGVDRTVKRAMPLRWLRRLRELDLSKTPELEYARDMFMLSFFLRGMSLVDMAFLKKSDLVGNMLTYRRRKTGQLLTIRWTSEMQEIVRHYRPNESEFLLPIIRQSGINPVYGYRHACRRINSSLKKLAECVGYRGNLTMYVARHSWASTARKKGIPINVISEGMGHNSERTTRIYLSELDSSIVDRANSVIMKALL